MQTAADIARLSHIEDGRAHVPLFEQSRFPTTEIIDRSVEIMNDITAKNLNKDILIFETDGAEVRVSFAPQSNHDIEDKIVQILTNAFLERLCPSHTEAT